MGLDARPARRAAAGLTLLFLCVGDGHAQDEPARMTNSIGMEFVAVEPGSFVMGESRAVPLALHEDMPWVARGDWDEHPTHRVEITRPYWIGTTEVTLEQYRRFDPAFDNPSPYAPYVTGISWYEARAFAEWLSRKEGRSYRLPTEAEWEYAARAGTSSLFWSGDAPPAEGAVSPWGLRNVHSGPAEWVADWHGEYPAGRQLDPTGPAEGFARVVRGGGLDRQTPFYARSANRASIGPDFPPRGVRERLAELEAAGLATRQETLADGDGEVMYRDFIRDVLHNQGNHNIGIRLVLGEPPPTPPASVRRPFFRQAVHQRNDRIGHGPPPDQPYFRKRRLLPIPPENTPTEQLGAVATAGLHPALMHHQHSPGLEVAPNGDLVAIYYTSVEETTPDVAMLATRLRYGADEWDMPDLLLDFADVDDHAPMLWTDGDSVRFFWGANKLDSGFSFQWISSGDNGATWTEVEYPVFRTAVGSHSAQPITSAFRDGDGTVFVASDGIGPESVLWVSPDDMRTWIDTGGRTGGRHTAFAPLSGGRILGMGGKSSDIDGFMPKSVSRDGGATWSITKTPFSALGSNQRPSLVRLASGRLFFAGDFQRVDGMRPEGIDRRGSYVALSDDEGRTWHIKALAGAEEHEDADKRATLGGATLGYSVARQAPNGLIHLITSMNEQALHFALNEAWILSDDPAHPGGAAPLQPTARSVEQLRRSEQRYPDGSFQAEWTGGLADDGRWLLHGTETWYYADGGKQWQAHYDRGAKVGEETYWREDGSRMWSRMHHPDGRTVWTRFWPDGRRRTQSTWRAMRAEGEAVSWDESGRVVDRVTFIDGEPQP